MTATTGHSTTRPGSAEEPTKLLTTIQAAASLGVGKRTLQERVAAREIATVRIGRCVRFLPDDLAAFVERNRVKAIGWKGVLK